MTTWVGMTALLLLLTACGNSAPGAARETLATGTFESFSYTNAAGTRTYKVYTPASYTGAPAPLLVDLHGCSSNADEEARWSRFNELAEDYGLLVAYPEQSSAANGSRCWNWFIEEHYHRDAGEPSLIAGITREVMAGWNVDAGRVYIAGISAGGAMVNIMVAAYPDLYAAAMSYAGCHYTGFCFGTASPVPAATAGQSMHTEMGPRARVVPVLVLQGDQDELVLYPNADIVVQTFLAADDLADDGVDNGSIPRARSATRSGQVPGGHAYDIDDYTDGDGCLLAQRWLIHGMKHAWSTPNGNGSARDVALTDPLGPDLSTPTFDFLLSYELGNNSQQPCRSYAP
ncbi:MAG TPA: PHB depolymerase family esterase [Verrucomicrobiae bacterium]|nr:PHB depolymerase family esterase [Verrucomicrobiae bacterium]